MKLKELVIGATLILLFTQFNSLAQVNTPDTISIDPKATYLRINNDPGTLDAIPIELSTLGIAEGDYLLLQQLGDYDNGPGGDIYDAMIGVFSSNDSLLDPTQPHRVPGAIDAGDDFVSSPTWSGNLPTDIPEDFRIDTTVVQVPDSAVFIFICAHDSKYGDNSDPDNDFGVSIEITTPPIGISEKDGNDIASNYHLSQNYPNPFNPTTTIRYSIGSRQFVSLRVYDLLGKEIALLVNEEKPAGEYIVQFDGSDLASGIYLYQIRADDFVQVKKLMLMK